MMERNAKLDAQVEKALEWGKAHAKRREERDILREAGDWDAVKKWDEREETEFAYPLTGGQDKALNAYYRSLRDGSTMVEMRSIPWESEMHDYLQYLADAGVDRIAIVEESSAVLRAVRALCTEGWTLTGPVTVTRENCHRFGQTEPETVEGIEFRHN